MELSICRVTSNNLLLDAYHRVAPSFGRVGGSKASTRSSNFGILLDVRESKPCSLAAREFGRKAKSLSLYLHC